MTLGDIVSPWVPMTDPIDLKCTGKLLEELGECSQAVARCQIQGINECNPITGKPNNEWLEEEIADVLANIDIVCNRFNLDWEKINARVSKKIQLLRQWHKL